MKPLIVLNLKAFANQIQRLALEPPGSKGSLCCLDGLVVPYEIIKRPSEMVSSTWDTVILNGNDHCGNRCGGINAYAQMVQDHLHNLNAEIINANEAERAKVPISLGL